MTTLAEVVTLTPYERRGLLVQASEERVQELAAAIDAEIAAIRQRSDLETGLYAYPMYGMGADGGVQQVGCWRVGLGPFSAERFRQAMADLNAWYVEVGLTSRRMVRAWIEYIAPDAHPNGERIVMATWEEEEKIV